MPSRRQRRAIKKFAEQACVVVVDAYLLARVICIYKRLLAKNLFMTIPNFEEFKQEGPNVARLVTEVIKDVSEQVLGTRCNDQVSEEWAIRGWQTLREQYQAEQQ